MRAARDVALRLGVLDTKLAAPAQPPFVIARPVLVDRLRDRSTPRLVGLVAPAGYGKSVVLGQWAAADRRPFAWFSADHRDDPAALVRGLAAALAPTTAIHGALERTLRHPGVSVWTSAMPRLGRAIASGRSVVLVVDDADRLPGRESVEVVLTIAEYLPEGSRLAFATRGEGAFPLARLAAGARLELIEADEFAFTAAETTAVVAATGRRLSSDAARALHERTDGWPAALHLLMMSSEPGSPAPVPATASRRYLLESYVREEVLPSAGHDEEFLLRTSFLDRLCAPLCDAVLERSDSARTIDRLSRSGQLLVRLDDEGRWYRYPRLLGELLLRELERREPGAIPGMARRAAAWHESVGLPELAIDHAILGDDPDRVARLVIAIGQAEASRGRIDTVRRWFRWLETHPSGADQGTLAGLGALTFATSGDAAEAERWLGVADGVASPDEPPLALGLRRLARAFLAVDGPAAMRADAEAAAQALGEHPFAATAHYTIGAAEAAHGDPDRAEREIEAGLAIWERHGVAHMGTAVALAYLADLRLERGDRDGADAFVRRARALVSEHGLDDDLGGVVAVAVGARLAAVRGAHEQARRDAAHAGLHRHIGSVAIPWLATRLRLDLARVHLALADPAAARVMLTEVREVAARRPLGSRSLSELDELERRVRHYPGDVGANAQLTAAELRVLPLLSTHLSFREIGDRLTVSQNTVKTQALSIYRKLDASSRSEAVARSVELGLLESP